MRERVTASVLLVRHVPITGKRGVRVVGRRAPSGPAPVHWVYEYDAGIDPEDPVVRAAAESALAAARTTSAPNDAARGARVPIRGARARLLICAGFRTIPCSSTGRAFDC